MDTSASLFTNFVANGAICITAAQAREAIQRVGIYAAVDVIMREIEMGTVTFPFKRYSLEPDALFAWLKKEAAKPMPREALMGLPPAGTPRGFKTPLFKAPVLAIFRASDEEYHLGDVICDYFTERARMEARRADTKQSPWDAWHGVLVPLEHDEAGQPMAPRRLDGHTCGLPENPPFSPVTRQLLVEELQRAAKSGQPLTSHSVREALYGAVPECTQFKPTLAISVIRYFGARHVLDFSAGWGDRLVGALACGVESYTAYDPNTRLRDGHNQIVARYGGSTKVRISYESYVPLGTDAPAAAKIDEPTPAPTLVFTSPPFFDLECYVAGKEGVAQGQSISAFPRFADWMRNFLFAALRKAWTALAVGGHMVIHFSDVGRHAACEPMNLFIQQLPGAHYLGQFSAMGGAGKARPLWVWRKTHTSDAGTSAMRYMQQFYPQLA